MHIGMDTVQLEGKYFTAHVKQGDQIKQGDLLVEFDIEKIKEAGFQVTTPVRNEKTLWLYLCGS